MMSSEFDPKELEAILCKCMEDGKLREILAKDDIPTNESATLSITSGAMEIITDFEIPIISSPVAVTSSETNFDQELKDFLDQAETNNSLIFEDGTQFSATETSVPPLLTVSIPAGLQFRESTGSIINQSQASSTDINELVFGLGVKPNKTLGLVGGNITLQEGGSILAPQARIELGSVAGTGQVGLQRIDSGWALSYEGVQSFQDIELTQFPSLISTTGIELQGGGSIRVQGKNIILKNGSQFFGDGADIMLSASQTVLVSGTGSGFPSSIANIAPLSGKEGSTIINAKNLIIQNGGGINVSTGGERTGDNFEQLTTSTVSAGNLIINASESVELKEGETLTGVGGNIDTGLFSSTNSFGAAGNITINTGKLIVRDGAIISAESSGLDALAQPIATGAAGKININASESLELNGGFISTETIGLGGDAGSLTIQTGKMNVTGGGKVLASTIGQGKGGNISVNASDFLNISGFDNEGSKSGLFAQSDGTGVAGNVKINTPKLTVSDAAEVTVSSPQGQAGNLTISANSLTLNRGSITAETGKSITEEGANITLQISDLLTLGNESLISATANGDANGGNININTPLLSVLPPTGPNGSDIIANAERGNGGNITINAQGIFGIAEGLALPGNQTNDIDASSQFGASGQVEINSTIDPNRGVVQLPETVVDPNALVAQNPCKRGSKSQFTRTGRGGLPPSLSEDLSSEATKVGLVEPAPIQAAQPETIEVEAKTSSSPSESTPMVAAQGWIFNEKGEVVLVAYDPTVTGPQRLKDNPAGCPAL